MEKLGVWERVDFGVHQFQYPKGRGAPPPDQVYRRVTLLFDARDFEEEKKGGIVWENHEGDLIEYMWFRPGEADRQFLQGEIAPVMGYARREPPLTWDILTPFYFNPSLGEERRVERLLPVAAEAGAPMRIRVL